MGRPLKPYTAITPTPFIYPQHPHPLRMDTMGLNEMLRATTLLCLLEIIHAAQEVKATATATGNLQGADTNAFSDFPKKLRLSGAGPKLYSQGIDVNGLYIRRDGILPKEAVMHYFTDP